MNAERSSTGLMGLAGRSPFANVTSREFTRAVSLTSVVLVSRALFVGRLFYQWDSINFALALEKFDVAIGQPQVPGYFLYVLLGRLVNGLVLNPKMALTSVSVVSSALAVMALIRLGKDLFNERSGLIAAVCLASSPLFWFYGELALPHALDALMVIVGVHWMHKLRRGHAQWAIPTAIWLGLAGGLRPQTEFFLLPLGVYAALSLNWRQRLVSAGVLALVNLIWLIPMLRLSGGLERYLEVAAAYANAFNQATSVFQGAGFGGLGHNAIKLTLYTAYGVGAFSLVGGLAVIDAVRRRRLRLSLHWPDGVVFLLVWSLPSLAYYLLIHMGQQGLVFVFLPAVLLMLAAAVDQAVASPKLMIGLISATVAVNAYVFLLLPTFPLNTQRVKLLTLSTIRENDSYLQDRIDTIRRNFDPKETLIVASGWRFVQFYLPSFVYQPYVLGGRWEDSEGQPTVKSTEEVTFGQLGLNPDADGNVELVLFEPELREFSHMSSQPFELPLAHGGYLEAYYVDASHKIAISGHDFEDVPQGGEQ